MGEGLEIIISQSSLWSKIHIQKDQWVDGGVQVGLGNLNGTCMDRGSFEFLSIISDIRIITHNYNYDNNSINVTIAEQHGRNRPHSWESDVVNSTVSACNDDAYAVEIRRSGKNLEISSTVDTRIEEFWGGV